MSLWRSFAWLIICVVLFGTMPVLAQTNPTVAACGLPAGGVIRQSVTYTMTADCELTSTLRIANKDPAITVSINGGGHTITGGNHDFIRGSSTVLNLTDVTIDGENIDHGAGGIYVQSGTLNAKQVTFARGNGRSMMSSSNASLTNVLLVGNVFNAPALGGNGSAVHAGPTTIHNWNNVVARNNFGSGGAISLGSGATLTTTGCLTLSGNVPYDVYAPTGTTWTDNSTGSCTGAIGNGDSAEIPAPALMACGFPAAGNQDFSSVYTLSADC
ncbi:MAG: hypothetical protein OXF90_07780, partial [Chloroflexi bacterium]|nr:hypothetical protein [Chloroflexota bacterium]